MVGTRRTLSRSDRPPQKCSPGDGVSSKEVKAESSTDQASETGSRNENDHLLAFSARGNAHQSIEPSPPPIDPISPASPERMIGNFESVGQYMQELMEVIRKLERLGVEKSKIPVPKIVVTGDQSAGKSSFIEAISQISVPRNAGTCTRCPVQITTSSSENPWRCEVKLISRYSYYDPEFLQTHGDCYVPGPFHPWQEAAETTTFHFASLKDPGEVCDTIARAQIAILSPSQDPTQFKTGPLPASKDVKIKFAPNHISLEISGPNLPNLSFYDLPGIISITRNPEEAYLVELVKNLVKQYVEDENTIVLLASPLEQDLEQSMTARIIQDADANHRCVGVLTKPDRFAAGAPVDSIREVLKGEALPLAHGYFVTKQPDQTQKALSHSDARSMEELFFARQAPWSTELSGLQSRFGIKNIQDALSKLLLTQITASIPQIHEKLTSRLDQVTKELRTLPEIPATDVTHVVSGCIHIFASQIRKLMRGRHPENAFQISWRIQKHSFRNRVTDLRPRFLVSSPNDGADIAELLRNSPGKVKSDFMDLTIDDNQDDLHTPQPKPDAFTTPKKRKAKEDTPFSAVQTPSKKSKSPVKQVPGKTLDIDYVASFLNNYSALGRKDTIDPEAENELILHGLEGWPKPTEELMATTRRSLEELLRNTAKELLSEHEKTQLFDTLLKTSSQFLNDKLSQYEQAARMALKHGKHIFWTLSDNALEEARTTAYKDLKEYRFRTRARKLLAVESERSGKPEADVAQALETPKEHQRLSGILQVDSADRELRVMANIRAYYTVASSRLVDNLCHAMEVEVFEELRTNLRAYLERNVLFTATNIQEHCAQLLAKDPESVERRVRLSLEKQHLEEASQLLNALLSKHRIEDFDKMDWDGPV